MVKCLDSRKIPRDLTEASLSGAGLSIVAALAMMFLFGMELNEYLSVHTSTSVIIDKSSDGEFLRIDFNLSFHALSCEFASVDVSDVLGTNRMNLTKTVRKFSIDSNLRPTGSEFYLRPSTNVIKHDDKVDDESLEGAFVFTSNNFDKYSHQFPITAVNFYAPWCYWSQRLRPSWEKTAKIIRERYDPEMDGRILLGKVDCTKEADLCRRHHIQGYPSIRIFRKGSDVRSDHGHHEHESYYGDRDTDSLVKTMENILASFPSEYYKLALEDKLNVTEDSKRPAPSSGGCRIEGYVRVKKVPGNLIISARSDAHSFDASQMNMSHAVHHLSFGKKLSPKLMSDVQRLIPYVGNSHDRLDGLSFINSHDFGANVTLEHYLQIVKTEVITRQGYQLVEEYEYTAHSSLAHSLHVPVARFHLQLSPMQVLITEDHKSFSHFITNVCAIVGGVFTVAGITESILHNTIRLMRKVELGKNF
ncbi:protein disulfide isomerase-like 5-4 [Medicago truncatula]|uniref:protein disulfide isomerase-like 5-4 n=1 Tax=Medicago truncatula TaxID=3880 RepID=UPI001967E46E|nr:protein disulfide isomerase-like 5-4 [Medicago truncatula]